MMNIPIATILVNIPSSQPPASAGTSRRREKKPSPPRGRWHSEAVTDEVEDRRVPRQPRKTQKPTVGADAHIRPNAGRFKRAVAVKMISPVAPAISRHIA